MALTIDLAAKTIALSPGALLAGSGRRIGFDRGEGFERLWIGQAVHRRVLGENLETVPGYAVEKAIRLSFAVDDYTAVLEGRLDGRWEDGGRVVVDEVKSLHFAEDLARLPGSPRLERFQLQLRWYMHAVAAAEGREVTGRLILADIETGATKIIEVAHDPDKTLPDLVRRTRLLLDEFLEERALAEAKAAEAGTLVFPHETYRLGQSEMEEAAARAAAQGEHLLAEAPTGIGKTAAAVFPLLKAALESGRRLYVLTAKTTQQEIYEKTIGLVEGDSFRSVRLRAKERMCANDVVLCHEDHCAYAKDYGAKMEASGLLERLVETHRHLDPDTVFEESRAEIVCPFEVSLELAERADVVIGDYNYVFDPVVALSGAREPAALKDAFLLVDEAHNLVDRGRGYYSPELAESELRTLEQRIGVSSAKTAWDAGEAVRRILKLVVEAASILPEEEREAADLVTLDEARLDDLRLDMESLLVRHLAEMRSGRRARAGRPGPRPLLHVRAVPRRVEAGRRGRQGRRGVRHPRLAGTEGREARDPLQGPVAPPRRDAQRRRRDGLDVRDALPARVLPRPPRARRGPHDGPAPAVAVPAREPRDPDRPGRRHDVRGARQGSSAHRGARRGRRRAAARATSSRFSRPTGSSTTCARTCPRFRGGASCARPTARRRSSATASSPP